VAIAAIFAIFAVRDPPPSANTRKSEIIAAAAQLQLQDALRLDVPRSLSLSVDATVMRVKRNTRESD